MKIIFTAIKINLIALLVFLIIRALLGIPHFPSPAEIKKTCILNMRSIDRAAELYQIENKQPPPPTASILATERFMKNEPKCRPYVKQFMGIPIGWSSPLTYKLLITKPKDTGEVIIDVECDAHGTLSRQDSTDSKKGL